MMELTKKVSNKGPKVFRHNGSSLKIKSKKKDDNKGERKEKGLIS